jgi:hypothetical protein
MKLIRPAGKTIVKIFDLFLAPIFFFSNISILFSFFFVIKYVIDNFNIGFGNNTYYSNSNLLDNIENQIDSLPDSITATTFLDNNLLFFGVIAIGLIIVGGLILPAGTIIFILDIKMLKLKQIYIKKKIFKLIQMLQLLVN